MGVLDKIMLLMTEKGYNQLYITEYLGVDRSIFSTWKNGKSKSYMKYLPQLADLFGVSLDWLIGKTEERNQSQHTAPKIRYVNTRAEDLGTSVILASGISMRVRKNYVFFASKRGETLKVALEKAGTSPKFLDSLAKAGKVSVADLMLAANYFDVEFELIISYDLTKSTGRNIAKWFDERPFDANKISLLGQSVDKIKMWLSQGYCPDPAELELIADAFGVSIIELPIPYDEIQEMISVKTLISNDDVQLLRAAAKLNPQGRERVRQYTQEMAEVYPKK